MVKKIVTLLIFAALIVLAFLQYFYIKSSSKDFTVLGEEAISFAEAGDMESAYRITEDLHSKWAKKKDHFEALMEHNETDKISMGMEKALSFGHQKDKVQFLAEMTALVFLLEHIHEIDTISWENIL